MGDRWEIREHRLKRCPVKQITKESLELIEAYKDYKTGHLYHSGGIENQSNMFDEARKIIDAEVSFLEKQNKKGSEK